MAPDLEIERFAYTDFGTFGRMLIDRQFLYTVERPWRGNEVRISCIPEGEYRCGPRRYNRGNYDAVEVRNVPERTYILFHKANTMNDVEGCIAVVSRLGVLNRQWAGLDSRSAFAFFMDSFGDREFTLLIQRYEPKGMQISTPLGETSAS